MTTAVRTCAASACAFNAESSCNALAITVAGSDRTPGCGTFVQLDVRRPVIVDMCVDQKENCFPMIPGGRAHNEILLGPADQQGNGMQRDSTPEEGMVLV